jgi:phage shock protein PspC (stress-responsive transcriptional regulator)
MTEWKQCPYCAEEVRAEAVKCKHCGSRLAGGMAGLEIYRSAEHKMIAGVCGGIAEYFGVPVAIVRLAFVLMTVFMGGVGLLVYVVLWIVMPQEDAWAADARRFPETSRPGGAPPG